jgi:NarL family two-component system response regulator LiaR
MADRRLPLKELAVGLWGRHELYLMSLAALLSHRGAQVQLLDDPAGAMTDLVKGRIGVLVLESPLSSDLARAVDAGLPVIVLEERIDPDDARHAVSLGARAILGKNGSLTDLTRAIRDAVEQPPPQPIGELTARQREVLRLIASGLDNAQIATRLGISQRTARAHVSGVLERLGVANRTQAAVTAVRRGWVG